MAASSAIGFRREDITYAQGWSKVKVSEYRTLMEQVIRQSEKRTIDKFIFRVEHSNGSHEFTSLPYGLLPLVINWTTDIKCSFHELILGPWRRFFMDIESTNRSVRKAAVAAKDAIKRVYGEHIRVIITCASDEHKSSYHIICTNLVLGSNDDLLEAVNLVLREANDDDLSLAIDRGIYKERTQMRIYHSCKKGVRPFLLKEEISDKPLRLSDMFVTTPNMIDLEDCTVIGMPKKYIESVSNRKLDPSTLTKINALGLEVHELPGGRVHFTGDCPICQRHHDSDNAKITEYETGVYVYCFRASSGKFFPDKKKKRRKLQSEEHSDD